MSCNVQNYSFANLHHVRLIALLSFGVLASANNFAVPAHLRTLSSSSFSGWYMTIYHEQAGLADATLTVNKSGAIGALP